MKLSDNVLSNGPHALHTFPIQVEKHLETLKKQKIIDLYVSKSLKHWGMMAPPSWMGLRRSNYCKRGKIKPRLEYDDA